MRWLSEPAWLFALIVMPLIWWLHRFRSEDKTYRVSALFLWPQVSTTTEGSLHKKRADIIWWLRAAIVVALVIALANPLANTRRPITVWVDDSISMYTVESGDTRMAHALRMLDEQLATEQYSLVTVRPLSDPIQSFSLPSTPGRRHYEFLTDRFANYGGEPDAPAAIRIESVSRHWVITDTADSRLNRWISNLSPERVISFGSETDNLVLGDFSLRPMLLREGTLLAHATVHNLGSFSSAATLVATRNRETIFDAKKTIAPGGSEAFSFETDASDLPITVQLHADDALLLDNVFSLTAPGKIRIRFDEACGQSLRSALSVHPGILINAEPADTQIACNATVDESIPAVQIHSGGHPVPAPTAHWMAARGNVKTLSFDISRIDGIAHNPTGDSVLMYAGDQPLITRRDTTPQNIDVLFDLNDSSLVSQPAYPLLVSRLVDNLPGHNSLEPLSLRKRNIAASKIAPRSLPVTPAAARSVLSIQSASYTWILILIVLILLAMELWLLRRRRLQRGPIAS